MATAKFTAYRRRVDVRLLVDGNSVGYEEQQRSAQHAEQLGYAGWFTADHLAASGPGGPTDPFVTLAGLAVATSRLRLGTLVSPVTFRDPARLLVSLAQLDSMSGGRIEIGLGAGWDGTEHAAAGIRFPGAPERFDLLQEQLEILAAWSQNDRPECSYEGIHYRLVLVQLPVPRPVQAPHPPVIIGGRGASRTPELAARFATEFNSLRQAPEHLPAIYARVRSACERIGRDPMTLTMSAAVIPVCGVDDAEVATRLPGDPERRRRLLADSAVGTPEEVARRLSEFARAGATRLYLRLPEIRDLAHVELLATQVLPRIRW